ncbi:hypothetical protein J2S74_004952 [Evansella vedderi]|uniref:NADH dehydrogenase subunit 6 n=1 Tax=Evansella vedderi TaxID=38282 RepID=A0ABU0A1X1_9BACI|nr:hypothetical protein [Evansella vedderi]MDQ0257494.1 hypothetical protein [Evansella vedderi]
MEGFWFFWVMWLIIIGFFFFDNNKKRSEKWVFLCLLLIICSTIVIPVWNITLRLSFIILGCLCFYHIGKLKWSDKIYCYVVLTFISGMYLLVQYFIYFEPVWLYVSPRTMTCFIALITTIIFIKNHIKRITIMIAGLFQGELLFSLMLWERSHIYFYSVILGDYLFMDIFSISLLGIISWNGLELAVNLFRNRITYQPAPTSHKKLNA